MKDKNKVQSSCKTCKRKKVYIAGKISGDKDFAKKFADAEKFLSEKGYQVLNPARLPQNVAGKKYKDYIDESHEMLKIADAIYLINDWRESRGAILERMYAAICGIEKINVYGFPEPFDINWGKCKYGKLD